MGQLADAQDAPVAIEVYAYNQRPFSFAMSGTQPDYQHWVKRKRQTVLRFGHSTAYIGRYNQAKNRDFEQQTHINTENIARTEVPFRFV
jgi:uncharacterized protein (UPF0303 family)